VTSAVCFATLMKSFCGLEAGASKMLPGGDEGALGGLRSQIQSHSGCSSYREVLRRGVIRTRNELATFDAEACNRALSEFRAGDLGDRRSDSDRPRFFPGQGQGGDGGTNFAPVMVLVPN